MLKTTYVLLSLTFTLCAAVDYERREHVNPNNARILNYQFENVGTGAYRFGFSSSDGITRQEEGNIINPKTEDEALIVAGSYSYVGPDGVTYTVKYTADQNGFHPEGDHIRVPPFVPWTKHQHDADHSEHYHHQSVTQSPAIYYQPTQRPFYTNTVPVYGSSNIQKPLITHYIPSNQLSLTPSLTQAVSSTAKPQVFVEPANLLAYLPTRRDVEASEEGQSSNVANSILEILANEKEDKNKTSVKIEDVNSL